MKLTLQIRDRNRDVILACREQFKDLIMSGIVSASVGDIFADTEADALLSPANSFGYMDGGIDAAYLAKFGIGLEARLQAEIRDHHFGELHVGEALIIPTGDVPIAWLVAAPTMRIPMDVSKTLNAYVAFRAALAAIHRQNLGQQKIRSLLTPGLCTAIGRMNATVAAHQMRVAWDTIVGDTRFVRPEDVHASQLDLEAPRP